MVLVDAHVVVREALRALIEEEDDFVVVGQAASAVEATALDVDPDVVVADFELPDARCSQVSTILRARFDSAAIFVLTDVDHPEKVQRMLAAGAVGYLLKTASPKQLTFGLRAVAGGETFLQPSLGVKIARWNRSELEGNAGSQLSAREGAILKLVALGHTNAEVASLLNFSLRTIEMHRARLMRKLGQPKRHDLVRRAMDLGLIDKQQTAHAVTSETIGTWSA